MYANQNIKSTAEEVGTLLGLDMAAVMAPALVLEQEASDMVVGMGQAEVLAKELGGVAEMARAAEQSQVGVMVEETAGNK
jgi:hypothetical protein